jgi:hypothetical protein
MPFFYYLLPLFSGLLTAQCIASLQVYLSNLQIHQLIANSASINADAINNLQLPSHAFFGGLFFTFTIGLFVSAVCIFLCHLHKRYSFSKKIIILLLIIWILLYSFFTSTHFFSFMGAYLFFIPVVVLLSFRYQKINLYFKYPIAASVLTLILLAQNYSFINVRDYLLLSNPVGIKISEFYYKYTFYPAEIIKPSSKKLFKAKHHTDPDLGLNHDPYKHFRLLILISLMVNLGIILVFFYSLLFSVLSNQKPMVKIGIISLLLVFLLNIKIEQPEIAKRYWQVKALANPFTQHNIQLLRNALQDPQINIICMALQAMGKTKNSIFITDIINTIKTSDHWYVQLYAQQALKKLIKNRQPSDSIKINQLIPQIFIPEKTHESKVIL